MKDMHREVSGGPLAYFVTVRTYGTWLHGDEKGAVDRENNQYGAELVEVSEAKRRSEEGRLKHPPTVLTAEGAAVVEKTIREVCAHRGWKLFEVAARTNHFHAIVGARVTGERVMNDLKAWGTRRLREGGFVGATQEVWVQHGSTPHLYTEGELMAAIEYVRDGQGPPLKPGGGAQGNP